MRDFLTLFAHLIMTLVRLMGPGGARPIVAESLSVKHQQLIVNRFHQRACGLRIHNQAAMGCCYRLRQQDFHQ